MKTPHPHQDILIVYAADTSVKIERKATGEIKWFPSHIGAMFSYPEDSFRLKPKRITVTGMDGKEYSFPEPMRVAPGFGTEYWVVNGTDVYESQWDNDAIDAKRLTLGICQATEQGAVEQRAALIAVCGGVV